MNKLDHEHMIAICKLGTQECCAYLVCGESGFECAKDTDLEPLLKVRSKIKHQTAIVSNCKGVIRDES